MALSLATKVTSGAQRSFRIRDSWLVCPRGLLYWNTPRRGKCVSKPRTSRLSIQKAMESPLVMSS